jgi:hypothetical protein
MLQLIAALICINFPHFRRHNAVAGGMSVWPAFTLSTQPARSALTRANDLAFMMVSKPVAPKPA